MGFVATLQALVERLEAAGVEAASDRRDLNPPAVLVTPVALLAPTKLCGRGWLAANLDLVVGDTGDDPALVQLEKLYDVVAPAVADIVVPGDRDFTRVSTTDSPDQLPGLRIPVQTPIA